MQPKFTQHPTNPALWDNTLKRWYVHNGSQLLLDIGNFLDFKETELVRSISVAIDLRLMTPLSGSIASLGVDTPIATLSSDISFALTFQYNSALGTYFYNLLMISPVDTWAGTGNGHRRDVLPDHDTVLIIRITRSIADPTLIWCWTNEMQVSGG